jgi:hypothetical protein
VAWKTVDIHEQRVRFVVAAAQGVQPISSLCAEFGSSRPTGYLWLRGYKELGVRGITEQSRRPLFSPRRTEARSEQRVLQVRLRYPDWGARKLRVVLLREGVNLPRNTIHRIYYVMVWFERKTRARQRGNVLNESNPTSYGRWSSRGRKDGHSRSDLFRCLASAIR